MPSAQSSSAKLFTTVIVLGKGSQQCWGNVRRGQWPEWGQKHVPERNWVPLGEGSAERPVEMKQVAQIMHVLLCQSVLSFCLGAENENSSYLHGKHWSRIVLFLSWVESVVVVQDNSDVLEKKLVFLPREMWEEQLPVETGARRWLSSLSLPMSILTRPLLPKDKWCCFLWTTMCFCLFAFIVIVFFFTCSVRVIGK